jgi:hypothetical protein
MRKYLLLLLFSPLVLHAQDWSTLNADIVVTGNGSSTGTTLTTAVGNSLTSCGGNCTVGTNVNFSGGPSGGTPSTSFTVEANQNACSNLGPIQLQNGGTLYPAQSLNYNSLAHDDSANNTNAGITLTGTPGSATTVSALACITLGPPLQTSSGNDWDVMGLWAGNGDYSEAQLNNSCPGSSEYGIRIEDKPTAHSACIPLAPQETYYVALSVNFTTGFTSMWVYSAGGSLIGNVTHTAGDTGSSIAYLQFGNNENGSNPGTFTYYQNILIKFNGASTSTPLFWTNTALSAGVLAPQRAIDWTVSGSSTINTTRTQCVTTACATMTTNGASSTTAQINAALASAPSNTYVSLPAGTYSSATSGITFGGVSNVTLRGAGANQTFLAPTSTSGGGSIFMGTGTNSAGSPQNGPVAVTGSTVQGSTTLTLASVPNLVVGNPIILDQLDPSCDNGGILVTGSGSGYTCTAVSPGLGGPYNTQGGGNGIRGGSGCSSPSNPNTTCFHQQQHVTVTQCDGNTTIGHACSSGANITIYPSLHMPNWSTANMFAWWATSPVLNDGVENLSVDSTNNSGANGIQITNCQGCWVKGVRSMTTSEAQVQMLYSNQITVRDSYFFLTQGIGTISYGVECYSCSDPLVENNIFHAVTTPLIANGPQSGGVEDYNFAINEFYTPSTQFSIPARGDHAADTDMVLTEGNIYNGVTADNIHGTSNMNTYARNYSPVQPQCYSSGGTYAAASYAACNSGITNYQIFAFHRFFNLIGNVLGTSGTLTNYCNGTTACSGGFTATNNNVLGVGIGNGGVPNDSNTVSTIMLWGNADPVTGYASPRFNSSEVPAYPAAGTGNSSIHGTQYQYLNAAPATNTIPASFFYSSTPSWWTSGKSWPPIGPDVTTGNLLICSGGAQTRAVVTNSSQCPSGTTAAAVNNEAVSIPAMDCYLNTMNGPANGVTTGPLSFNASTCYSGTTIASPMSLSGTLAGAAIAQ